MKRVYLLGGGLTLLAALIAGCNNNDDTRTASGSSGGSTTTVTVTPSLGKIVNAKVVLRNAKTGATLGTGNTGNTGVATFAANTTTDPVVAEVSAQENTKYFDESKGAEVSLGAQKLRAAVPALTANIGISTLTDVAYQLAVKKAGNDEKNITPAIATAVNESVRTALAPELGSITTPPRLIGSAADLTMLANDAASKYALKLAALAKLAPAADAAPALAVLNQLAADIVSDEKLDGAATGPTVTFNYTQANLVTQLLNNLNATIQAANLTGLNFNVNQFSPVTGTIVININTGGTGGTGGTGSGQTCVATANYNLVVQGFPINQSVKYCYTNFPANSVCGSANQVLNGAVNNIQVPNVSGSISWSFNPAAACPADALVQINYGNLGG